MNQLVRRLRTPEERVGMLPNASLPPPRQDDELLLRALRDRDEQSFGDVLDRHYPAMLRVAQSHVRSAAIAEEVIQETWLAALEGIGRFEGRSSVRTWLVQILRNIARARGRRDARIRSFSDLQTSQHGAAWGPDEHVHAATPGAGAAALWTTGSDPEQELLSRELEGRVEAGIAALPPRQREVLVLRDIEGWSAEDVCNVLAISDTNQRVLLHRARSRIRSEMRAYLGDDDICAETNDVAVR